MCGRMQLGEHDEKEKIKGECINLTPLFDLRSKLAPNVTFETFYA